MTNEIHMYMYIYSHIYTYIRTYIYTYTYIEREMESWLEKRRDRAMLRLGSSAFHTREQSSYLCLVFIALLSRVSGMEFESASENDDSKFFLLTLESDDDSTESEEFNSDDDSTESEECACSRTCVGHSRVRFLSLARMHAYLALLDQAFIGFEVRHVLLHHFHLARDLLLHTDVGLQRWNGV